MDFPWELVAQGERSNSAESLQLGVCGMHTGNADIYSSPSASFSQPLFSSSSIAL